MRKIYLRLFIATLGFVFILAGLPSVHAQDKEEFTLEEITVTAEKRAVDLQKVPFAMESLSGNDLELFAKHNFSDVFSQMPSVILQDSTRGGNSLAIRGVSQLSGGRQNVPVSVHIDGAYSSRFDSGVAGLLDIDRIEVLIGPQGTLFGALSTAGSINIITRQPVQKWEASGSFEMGNYNLTSAQGVLNAPISEDWALRVAFQMIDRAGYITGGMNDADEKSARLKAKFEPNDDFNIVFTYDNQKVRGRGRGFVHPWKLDTPKDAWANPLYPNDTASSTDDLTYRYSMDLSWDLGFANMKFLPNYRQLRRQFNWMLQNNLQHRVEDVDELNAEWQLLSQDDSKADWILGVFYYDYDGFTETFNPGRTIPNNRLSYDDKDNKAIFGNLKYPIYNDEVILSGGARYTRLYQLSDSYDTVTKTWGMHQEGTKSNVDYKIGVEYSPSDKTMYWLNYSTGWRGGMPDTPSEYLKAYQVGAKNRFLDNSLQLNWSAFYYDYVDYQCSTTIDYIDGTFNMGSGIGDARILGLDVATNYIFAQKNRIDLSLAYLDASYIDVLVHYDQRIIDPTTGLPTPDEVFGSDTAMPNAPKWLVTAGYERSFDLQNGGALSVKVDTRYQLTESRITFSADPRQGLTSEDITNPKHHISNALISYTSPEGKLSVSAYIKNIENFPVKNGLMGWQMQIGSPRTYGALLSIKY